MLREKQNKKQTNKKRKVTCVLSVSTHLQNQLYQLYNFTERSWNIFTETGDQV